VTGFVLRAPWYVRERGELDVLQPEAFRPAIQMYDGTDFVKRLLKDPRDSLEFTDEDRWSYPVPVSLADQRKAEGRLRLATHQLVVTRMRKLYQPSHNRFYVVVVEVLCDEPGLPRAGRHDDFTVGFVMRRHHTSITGARRPTRRLARNLLRDLAARQGVPLDGSEPPEDVRDVWWAENAGAAEFERFTGENRDLVDQLGIAHHHQGWIVPDGAPAGWQDVDGELPAAHEQPLPMWRIPRREDDCDAAATRSTWFGVVPTHSADHFAVEGTSFPKLDDHAVYDLRCFVTVIPPKGHEHCPPAVYGGRATRPFRLAAPMDPQGNSHRTTSITLPDLRRLAAQAGRPMGPGGVRITTPPNSQLVFNPFKGIPESGAGAIGVGGGVCTFAFELFFIVAFFLFLLFLPVVVFAFQLWWMLALRFCLPPTGSLDVLTGFFADKDLGALSVDQRFRFDAQFGVDSTALDPPPHKGSGGLVVDQLKEAKDEKGNAIFVADHRFVQALLIGTDPAAALPDLPPRLETKPDDPLCG
jgi:hypothetical protein